MSNTSTVRLHRFALSGHCHRVELLLSLLSVEAALIDVDLARGEHKTPAFLAKNPFGQVPVLEDGPLVLGDSNAILVYLALRYDKARRYLPVDPVAQAQVQRWLSVAAGQLAYGPAALRAARLFKAPADIETGALTARALFSVLDAELSRAPFLAAPHETLADVALYAYTKAAPEGGLELSPYPSVRTWLARVEALPGFVPMKSAS